MTARSAGVTTQLTKLFVVNPTSSRVKDFLKTSIFNIKPEKFPTLAERIFSRLSDE
jgi:hypothetical protein